MAGLRGHQIWVGDGGWRQATLKIKEKCVGMHYLYKVLSHAGIKTGYKERK